jgi:hypothetical protein
MLYLGHFSFDAPEADDTHDSDDADDDARRGYFSVLAQAPTVAEAFEKFRRLIPRLGRTQEIFEAGTQVWLDSCIEVREMPSDGLLAHVVLALGPEGSMSVSLVGAPAGAGEAYGWGVQGGNRPGMSFGSEPRDDDDGEDEIRMPTRGADEITLEPFLVIA